MAIKNIAMKPMPLWKEAIAYVTLGLLCGWYYFIMILYPILIFLIIRGSYIAGAIFLTLIYLTFVPLKFKPWEAFMYCWIWKLWHEYFDVSSDLSSIQNMDPKKRYVYFEFPHGIFPMGQFLSVYWIRNLPTGKMICGTGADAVFMFPVMRQIMAWIGTVPANRKSMSKVYEDGNYGAVIPGGIAEMYIGDDNQEAVFFRKRVNTVKLAIQNGAHIIPVFFFGNSRILRSTNQGPDSFFSKLSRKLRASIVLFYGRNYLPVPFRHPIRMVTGEIVEVKQNDTPTDEEIQETMERVIKSLQTMYDTKKPEWETRPLVIQ